MTSIPHSRFKAKVLAAASCIVALAMLLAVYRPQTAEALASMVAAYCIFCGALIGARALHQYSAARYIKEEGAHPDEYANTGGKI
jgi:hypothetical protein